MNAARPIELRVLVGSQAGSRLVLSPGEYAIGTSDACAVILAGPQVKPVHATILVGADTLQVEARDGTLRDATGAELLGTSTIELGQAIKVGTLWIAVDAHEAPWPDAATLESSSQTPVVEPPPAELVGVPETAIASVRQGPEAGKLPSGKVVLAFLGLVLVAGILYCLQVLLMTNEPPPVPRLAVAEGPSLEQRLKDVIARIDGRGHLSLAPSASRHWKVSGVLPTAAERRAATDALASIDPLPELDLWSDEELLARASSTLAANAAGMQAWIRVESRGDGVLQLVGAARESAYVEAVQSGITTGVPGVRRVDSSVLLPAALPRELVDRIDGAGLTPYLRFTVEPSGAVVTGTPNDEEIAAWQRVADAFHVDYGDVLPLHVAFTRPVMHLPFEIKTIVGGAAPYVLTSTHMHVAPGGQVDGFTLTAIDAAGAVFDGKQRLVVLR